MQRDTRWQGRVLDDTDAKLQGSGERTVLRGRVDSVVAPRPAVVSAAAEAEVAPVPRHEVPPFAEVFRTYSPFVWRVLLRLGVAEADIDDVAQEVFLGVHRNLPRFEGRCSLRTWVYGICHRRAVDYRRRASVRPELYSDDPPEQGVAASQEQGLVLSQARAQLAAVLDGLDEEKRTVFVLFDIEGVPMDEVAEIVGCPLQTAYSRLYAARRKVEATLLRLRSDRRSV